VKFSRRTKPEVDVNLTPLIDVVFLLLIFFMVSTTFTKDTQLTIDLPEASGTQSPTAQQRIEITVTRAGGYAINQVTLVNNLAAYYYSRLGNLTSGGRYGDGCCRPVGF
jgi:biopolymer transport protein ExbD